ncbi:hypothetical protein SAMN04490194_1513 [Pseudomonas migulae]|uniref:Uncharacterized protein n=1 Tax=Pseudomonas migulae TaxID=78543 RepID=A0A1H5H8L6_9PSED|nr:hypothetical protein SAMN04490194_1513 [Pseudomonas migulae]
MFLDSYSIARSDIIGRAWIAVHLTGFMVIGERGGWQQKSTMLRDPGNGPFS